MAHLRGTRHRLQQQIIRGCANYKTGIDVSYAMVMGRRNWCSWLFALVLPFMASAQQSSGSQAPPLGSPPAPAAVPRLQFAFEFRVSLAPAVVLGQTPFGHRQYIAITGGKIAGPKFSGEVLPGGWDYQLGLSDGCTMLSADYFIRADDGTVIHVLNEGIACAPRGVGAPRSFFRPRFEAPKGPHAWLTHSTFVATLELEPSTAQSGAAAPRTLNAIRLKFYQVQ